MNEEKSKLSGLINESAIQRYILRRGEEVQKCWGALERSDFSVLEATAHKILGNCRTFGFEDLEELALDMQNSAQALDLGLCTQNLEKLQSWVKKNKT